MKPMPFNPTTITFKYNSTKLKQPRNKITRSQLSSDLSLPKNVAKYNKDPLYPGLGRNRAFYVQVEGVRLIHQHFLWGGDAGNECGEDTLQYFATCKSPFTTSLRGGHLNPMFFSQGRNQKGRPLLLSYKLRSLEKVNYSKDRTDIPFNSLNEHWKWDSKTSHL